MKMSERALPVILSALSVVVIGCWNPVALQSKTHEGQPSGHSSYFFIAVIALLVGLLVAYFTNEEPFTFDS